MNPEDYTMDPGLYADPGTYDNQDLTGATSSLLLSAASVGLNAAAVNLAGAIAPGTIPPGYNGGSGGAGLIQQHSAWPQWAPWAVGAGVILLALVVLKKV